MRTRSPSTTACGITATFAAPIAVVRRQMVAHQAHYGEKEPRDTQRMRGLREIHNAQMPKAANATAQYRSHGHGTFE
jgi:hypothetical protein